MRTRLLFILLLVAFCPVKAGARSPAQVAPTYADVSYGTDPKQTMDVYVPAGAKNTPILFIVHGGAWSGGDKQAEEVAGENITYWLEKGYVIVSTNYRVFPDVGPFQESEDVAHAIGFAQKNAAKWGGNSEDLILMGHSAGAHLVALLAARPEFAYLRGAQPWRGTIVLDSAALDVVSLMEREHPRFYNPVFGDDPLFWEQVSPYHKLSQGATPFLLVCSEGFNEMTCDEERALAKRAKKFQIRTQILPQKLNHMDIMRTLGKAGPYTEAVNTFMESLLKPEKK